MSGETTAVLLAGGPVADRLVGALSRLAAIRPTFVLVGGLAVMARLAQAHRATHDLDALVTGAEFTEAVVALPEGEIDDGQLLLNRVPIDRIVVPSDTSWTDIAKLEEPMDRLFTGAHLWALQTAAPLVIAAGQSRAETPVATTTALLATKLCAYLSRRDERKRAGDALDVWRLGQLIVQDPTDGFEAAPSVVREAVRWALVEGLVDRPGEMVRRLRGILGDGSPATPGDVVALAEVLLEHVSG